MLSRDHQRGHAENLRGGKGVNVVASIEGFHEQRIARKMSQQAEFDLRVVGSEQNMPGFGRESGADFTAEFGADRDVLQVRVR
jgi:hypothetical protein